MVNRGKGKQPAEKAPGGGKGGKKSNESGGKNNGFQNGKGKSSGKGKKFEAPKGQASGTTVKTVTELEAELQQSKALAASVRREASKQALEYNGTYCQVKKHSDMGCAVVSFKDQQTRDLVLNLVKARAVEKVDDKNKARQVFPIDGVEVQWREHFDKDTQQHLVTDIFVAWGRQAEKSNGLDATAIAQAVDALALESNAGQVLQHGLSLSSALPPPPPPVHHADQLLQSSMVAAFPDLYSQMYAHQAAQQQAMAMSAAALHQATAMPETPPRTGNRLRADAPSFTMTPPPGTPPAFPSGMDNSQYAINEYDQYADYNYEMATAVPENKALKIVDPKSGVPLEVPKLPGAEPQFQSPARKPMKILDPNSGNTIDTLGMILTPAKADKKFAIVDPSNGNSIQV